MYSVQEQTGGQVRIAASQYGGSSLWEDNMEMAENAIAEAQGIGVELICLHEMLNSDYFCPVDTADRSRKYETIPGRTTERLSELAKRYGLFVVAGVSETSPEGHYNSAFALNPEGQLVGKYRKLHRDGAEEKWFERGDLLAPLFSGPQGLQCGMLICYDRHFPEAADRLAAEGARLILAPSTSAFESWTFPIWKREWQAISSLLEVYTAASNRIGRDAASDVPLTYFGSSMIVDPDGKVLAEGKASGSGNLVWADIGLPLPVGASRRVGEDVLLDEVRLQAGLSDDGQRSLLVGQRTARIEPPRERQAMRLDIIGGIRIAYLNSFELNRMDLWRMAALVSVELFVVIGMRTRAGVLEAQLQYLAVSAPCAVLYFDWDDPSQSFGILPDGQVMDWNSTGFVFRRSVVERFKWNNGLERHRRVDLLEQMFRRIR